MSLGSPLSLLCGLVSFVAAAGDAGSESANQEAAPLLLVSFDGFRADYLQRFPMPHLKFLYSQGVLVEQLTNVFVTKTFPNHYSMVTGLFPESHGILASSMYDPASHKHFSIANDSDSFWWNQAQPLWITALDSGYTTAALMWPGSDVAIGGRRATHFLPYDRAMSFRERLRNVTNWIIGDGKEGGARFAALYWEEPDWSGHLFGPDNTSAMGAALREVDDNIGLMVSELKGAGLWGRVNLLVVSDHGMTQCSAQRLIRLDDCIPPDAYTLVDLTPVAALIPLRDPETIFSHLSKCHAHMTAYLKEAIPDRLHYRNNQRIQPILLVADEGWTIVQRGSKLPRWYELIRGWKMWTFHVSCLQSVALEGAALYLARVFTTNVGDHGYDNSLPSMHPFMAATGPGFRSGYSLPSLQSVDIYPLMCRLLAVPPRPNNGSLDRARCLLLQEGCVEASLVVGLVVGVLLLLTALTALFRFLGAPPASATRPFQRLQLEDDDEVLLGD